MTTCTEIAYLEISPRMTGKTTRLCNLAKAAAINGKPVVFVCAPQLVHWLPVQMPGVTVVADGSPLPSHMHADRCTWFYDEFDRLKSVKLRAGGYYSTTAARLRILGEDLPENDILMRLIQAHGNRHERHLWTFDYRDFVGPHRQTMSPEDFRLNMLGEFLS
ncbi:hypothetical protein HZF02_29275 [Pseudomonas yamanorum]|nr:hypothetical protein HZF02_29275 [Pseudomonas yamanorum]